MRRMNEPLDNAREQLREEFEQLRGEIEGLGAGESGAGDPPSGGGLRDRVRASLAVLALTAAVAAAAGNFALNGGRTPKDGSVSVPRPSNGPEPAVTRADRGSAEPSLSLLSLIGPGLQTDILGSNAGLPGAGNPTAGPSPLFVVGDPISASGHGSRGGDVQHADPVGHSPAPTPTSPAPEPEPHEPSLAFSPPPAPAGPGNGEGPSDGGQPGDGGHTAATTLEEDDPSGGEGPGKGKGHIKAKGKGHDGGSSGKGHEKDQEGGEVVVESAPGESGSPDDHPGGHGHGHGKGKGHGGGPPAPPPPPATPAPPSPEPGPGPKGNPGKSEDPGHGKSTAPGQVGK
jgi:hypothetical protein